jgi:hypothetical protein
VAETVLRRSETSVPVLLETPNVPVIVYNAEIFATSQLINQSTNQPVNQPNFAT